MDESLAVQAHEAPGPSSPYLSPPPLLFFRAPLVLDDLVRVCPELRIGFDSLVSFPWRPMSAIGSQGQGTAKHFQDHECAATSSRRCVADFIKFRRDHQV